MPKQGRSLNPLSPDQPAQIRLFTEELRRLYLRTTCTLEELASRTEISKSTWSRHLTGKTIPSADRLEQFAKITRPNSTEWKELKRLWTRAETMATAHRRTQLTAAPPTNEDDTDNGPNEQVKPRQLPTAIRHFVGRATELETLSTLLDNTTRTNGTVVISAINGTAGIGKTAIAVHWAHQAAHRFPDGQLYVNLRGFDPTGSPMHPAEAIRGFLDALTADSGHIPASLEAQINLYRSLLADKHLLIVLDNARDTDQIRPLLPGSPTCLTLITSRNQLTGLIATENAHPVTLDLLTDTEAHQLLTHHLGPHRVTTEPDAVAELIDQCAHLPLALSIAAARAATHPHFPLTALTAELRDERDRLDALDAGDTTTDLRAVFSWSHHHLSTEAARTFRLLGLHPGPDITTPATASLTNTPMTQARTTLTELTRAHLLTQHTPGRFTFHDLLRTYATEQTHTHDTETERHTATHRVLDHYLHTAHTAAVLLHPQRDPITLTPPQPGVRPEHLTDHGQGLTWFSAEHPVLLAAITQAAATGFDTHAWQLPWTLTDFFERRGRWRDRIATGHTALAGAGRLADRKGQAHTHLSLGRVYARLGRYDDAHTHLQGTLDLFGELGDQAGQARAHLALGGMCGRQGRHHEALTHNHQALDLYRAAGHRAGQTYALNNIGWHHARLGDHQQALTHCQQALSLQQKLGDHRGEGATLDSIGYAHHHLGQHAQAVARYQQAIDLFREHGDRYYETIVLTHLGDAHHAAGNPDAAREAWRQALDTLDDIGHPDADQVRTKLTNLDASPDNSPDNSEPRPTKDRLPQL